MKVYRVRRKRNRPVYGAWSQTGYQTKIVTKRSLSGMISQETQGSTYTIEKVEEAEVGEWHDITEQYVQERENGDG